MNKSKFKNYFFAGLMTILSLPVVMLSCNGGNGDDGGGTNGSATIPAVVFIADKDQDGVDELYASLNDGASVVKLSGTLAAGQNVADFKISPDGSRVAYRADQDTPGVIELYVSSITGGTSVRVSGSLVANGNVEVLPPLIFDAFHWSPDSSLIAYIADQVTDDVYELFVSAPDGSSNFKVSGSLAADGDVFDFEWAPDSTRVAFRADKDTNGQTELYTSRPLIASTPVKVSGPLPGAGNVHSSAAGVNSDAFEWAPDSSRIAYLADQINDNRFELFTSTPDGTDNDQVSGVLVAGRNVIEFKWAPASTRVAYLADQDSNDVFELYTSTPDGTDNDKVSVIPVAGGDVWEFGWAPNSTRVAYIADQDTDDVLELYTSPPDSSIGNAKVSFDPLVSGSSVATFEWSPDSTRIAYRADQDTDDVIEIYTSPPDSNIGNVKVSFLDPITIPGSDVFDYSWAPDSSRIAYIADQDSDNVFELYSSLPNGSVNDKVSGPLIPGGRVFSFKWAPDTSRIAYRADQNTDNVFELYSSLPDGSGNGNISGPIVLGGVVSAEFEYVP